MKQVSLCGDSFLEATPNLERRLRRFDGCFSEASFAISRDGVNPVGALCGRASLMSAVVQGQRLWHLPCTLEAVQLGLGQETAIGLGAYGAGAEGNATACAAPQGLICGGAAEQ